ncbi:2-succinyl-6-hydroxy-2,4-cyclohexadiene-1-carboxylate synthase [Photobacterium swingsii]|uniref:Putative 2-succinyl-6-hydroxy-2,4-cyclohexadiene-1-carboxylate synthase n=1 Tax=Photobacterium swingsii TaxID=680026 RepID=A0A0J8VCK9_9GAMM|nr:2-succinyl-6-hydroxy-2,4-cyclohexadiene-1-carboxylate synthase [Photobacterium swingsii]KMV30270.1 acyl-CoA thioester hydrolase [Photobacterium swingsii]PSW23257.1 2-succinyl-6-hydroxy-2,4-cyclohexadiene-1-carboxylate synthase [Photobacterium swingsii]
MLLYSESYYPSDLDLLQSKPTLVFLHGLLGSGQDWRLVIDYLSPYYTCLAIDLPGHGQSQCVTVTDFEQANAAITDTLLHRGVTDYVLVGYSLGARLAMYHGVSAWIGAQNVATNSAETAVNNQPKLKGLVIEGGHFGLPQTERATRFANDEKWAHRFAHEPMHQVLTDWYQQAVFSSLDHDQRQGLITKRSDNLGSAVAAMMMATSLSKQPELLPELQKLTVPHCYIYGEHDEKFKGLAQASAIDNIAVVGAGHNAHIEQPQAFSVCVEEFVKRC